MIGQYDYWDPTENPCNGAQCIQQNNGSYTFDCSPPWLYSCESPPWRDKNGYSCSEETQVITFRDDSPNPTWRYKLLAFTGPLEGSIAWVALNREKLSMAKVALPVSKPTPPPPPPPPTMMMSIRRVNLVSWREGGVDQKPCRAKSTFRLQQRLSRIRDGYQKF
ncbi:unnamed protein product [Cylindrotheca closterium]|uniref:Uncharacterized protein n=1 Tax=Cylindrotheca closterium TaxID=2856 RepID=A0AAD2CIG2_9STRA|nr:unnamed protein product [Cylindrotheca closterium]